MQKGSWKIGNVHIDNPTVLAPMEAVNCASFRVLCKRYDAGLIYSDMIDTKQFLSILKENNDDEEATVRQIINPQKEERPFTIQLGGGEPDDLAQVAQIVSSCADIIDLNCGCPLGYMLGRKGGAYMLKHHFKLEKMFRALKENATVPVTAKIRRGWDDDSDNAKESAKLLEHEGASALAVHARTAKDRYRSSAVWEVIKEVTQTVNVPVIGNGDVSTGARAVTMLGQTQCAGVMIARGAQGHPEIFTECNDAFAGNRYEPRSRKQCFHSFNEFLALYKEKEHREKLSELQDHAIWWVGGLDDASRFKQKILRVKTIQELEALFSKSL